MCGIAGALGDLGGVDTRAMRQALAHRGPDDEGEVTLSTAEGASLWLGHRRLSIQDLSPAGHQPMRSADGRRHIVFNGEVYNFRALRAELEALGARFRSGSDTEVILEGFLHWGDGCIDRLRGMFAFALWDEARDTLTLARDRLGEKPLYLHHTRERTLFASEVRALLASGAVPRELDDEGLDAFLTYGSRPTPSPSFTACARCCRARCSPSVAASSRGGATGPSAPSSPAPGCTAKTPWRRPARGSSSPSAG
jgi:asparagine synthase (glutamine-hydrolysing)